MKNLRSRYFWLTLGLIGTDALFFGLTNPVRVASILLIVGFALVVFSAYWLIYNLQRVATVYLPWLRPQRYLSLALTTGVGILIALQSVGQLTLRDALLIPLAALALYGYTTYGKNSTSP